MAIKKKACKHDHKNAIQIGPIDFVCPICRKLIDPLEWFLMNSFNFVDVKVDESRDEKADDCWQ